MYKVYVISYSCKLIIQIKMSAKIVIQTYPTVRYSSALIENHLE